MKKIYKYKLPVDGSVERINAAVVKWLQIGVQDDWPYIWAIVDTEGRSKEYEFIAWGTGWDVPNELLDCKYMGTAIDGYGYVWHYFMDEQENYAEKAYINNKIYNDISSNTTTNTGGYVYSLDCNGVLTINGVPLDYKSLSSVEGTGLTGSITGSL